MSSESWAQRRKEASVGFEPLEPSTYTFYVKSATAGVSKKGKDMFTLKLVVVDGPKAGKTVTEWLHVSPESDGAMSILFQNFDAMGVDEEFLATDPTSEQIAKKMEGAYVVSAVSNREYNGAIQNDFAPFKPAIGVDKGGEGDAAAIAAVANAVSETGAQTAAAPF